MKNFTFFLFFVILFVTTSCTKEEVDENAAIKTALIGSVWEYKLDHNHQQKTYESSDNSQAVKDVIKYCPAIGYTTRDSINEWRDTIDLCNKNGHQNEMLIRLNIRDDNQCVFNRTVSKTNQLVYKKSDCLLYTFQEGTYMGSFGGSNYFGVDVYSYGIYRATTGGMVLWLPFHSTYTYISSKVVYESRISSAIESDFNETMQCSFKNGELYFNNDEEEWKGVLNEESTMLTITQIKPESGKEYILVPR